MPRIVPIPWQRFECVILKCGCRFVREEGDHRIYNRENLIRPIVFPMEKDLPVFIIKNNLRILGVSRDDYFTKLKEC
ncbi:MAG: type II toxin-antitoxin system HicA family toxin [Dehalococcoidales bacterium]|nr:type II toxin-antitoxin system HicA family toxin [Dehalococcoidales bacterium]